MHNCPGCGTLTAGTASEGGHKWPLCSSCMDKEHPTVTEVEEEWPPAAGPERKKLLQRPKPEIHVLQVCKSCSHLTNAACSNWWSHKLEGMGVVTKCYARVEGLRWVRGCSYASDPRDGAAAEGHISRDKLDAPEEPHDA